MKDAATPAGGLTRTSSWIVWARPGSGGAIAVAGLVYLALATWLAVAAAPFGDQVHYLLGADRLARGSLDGTPDAELFRSLVGAAPSDADVATHVVVAPAGPRTVQGYAVAALITPGWMAAGRLGAHLTIALVAAFASAQLFLLLRETVRDRRLAGATWAIASFLPPLLPMATHLYPNVIGAALIVTAYRWLFTAPTRRPALAGALLAATLLLTPRDGLALLVLAPFAWRLGRGLGRRFTLGAAALAAAVVVLNAATYGIPLPYVGYLYGTQQAQALTGEPSISFRVWVALPAILFDRTFGLAGSAPWLFIGLLGLRAALGPSGRAGAASDGRRAAPAAGGRPAPGGRAGEAVSDSAKAGEGNGVHPLLPAAATVAASLAALSFFRYWEGGYAPPGRYFVDVLPLWAPFVAYGLAVTRTAAGPGVAARLALRAVIGTTVFMSALAAVIFAAIPMAALNGAYDHKFQLIYDRVLGLNPLGWLPSFQPTTPDWYVGAYLRLIPALAIAGALAWYGTRAARGDPARPTRVAEGAAPRPPSAPT